MVLETGRGLVVLNSCCHGGVVNIVKGVLDQFPGQRVYALLGGLHMLSPGANALNCPPDYVRPDKPPMFCMLLRKHLSGARLLELVQPPMERVVDLRLEALDELGDRVEPLTGGMRLGI